MDLHLVLLQHVNLTHAQELVMSMNRNSRLNSSLAFAALLLALLLGGIATAQDKPESSGLWDPFANPGPNAGVVTGQIGLRSQFIYPVEFVEIDGRRIASRNILWLKPGRYELTVRGFVSNPPGLQRQTRSQRNDANNRITVVVEAGKEYSIGTKRLDRSTGDRYTTVLYKVSEYPSGQPSQAPLEMDDPLDDGSKQDQP